jgi:hypothetical protein
VLVMMLHIPLTKVGNYCACPISHVYHRKYLNFDLFCLMTSRIMSETGHTVQVTNLSSRVSESDLHEFFSFSGPIEHIELIR